MFTKILSTITLAATLFMLGIKISHAIPSQHNCGNGCFIENSIQRASIFVSILLIILLTTSRALAIEPPHGYERLALHSGDSAGSSVADIESGVFERELPSFVYQFMANQLTLWNTSPNGPNVENRRLIDIEVHITGGNKHDIELGGVWIENKGFFKQESWLTLGFSETDLIEWPFKRELIPLDIERYTQGSGKEFFAVIWQENRHEVDWEVKLEVDSEDILRKVNEGYRVVDFDQFRAHLASPSFVSAQYFDAILVENSGDNYLDSQWKQIYANPLDTMVALTPTSPDEPQVEVEVFSPSLDQAAYWVTSIFGGFNVFADEKIVDVEFTEFPVGAEYFNYSDIHSLDIDFPDTWALVISHPVPNCRSKITEGHLQWGSGISSFDGQHDVGRVIDYEGTEPYQNRPLVNASIYGHNSSFYGPPGFGPNPTYIHACKSKYL